MGGSEDSSAEGGAIEGPAISFCGGWQKEIWRTAREVIDYLLVARSAGLDDLTCQNVGVDDWEVVGRLGEKGGDSGFAGCERAG